MGTSNFASMKHIGKTALLCAMLPLASCVSLGGTETPPFLLSLTPANSFAAGEVRTSPVGEAMVVQLPDTPRKLASLRVPVQVNDSTIAYLKDAVWVDKPNRLFQKLLSETLSAKSGRLVLNEVDAGGKAGLRIAGDLINFGLDASRRSVLVTFDAVKLRDGQPIEKQRFEVREEVLDESPATVGGGLNKAANKVADAVADWVG